MVLLAMHEIYNCICKTRFNSRVENTRLGFGIVVLQCVWVRWSAIQLTSREHKHKNGILKCVVPE